MRKPVLLSMLAIIAIVAYFIFRNLPKQVSSEIAIVSAVLPTPFEKGEENKQDGQRERLEQENIMTIDPALGYVPRERILVAEQKAARMAMQSRDMEMAALSWTERGPNNMGGRSRAVMIDKNDITGNTVWVGSVGGGLWKSTNFKAATPTWTPIASVSANLAITTLAQDPLTPNTMYAGTGEGYNNVDAIRGLGVYKSTNGGITWNLLASTTTGGANAADFGFVQKMIVNSNGDVYAACISTQFCNNGGILKSTDAGGTWTRVIGNFVAPPLPTVATCANAAFDFNGYDIEIALNGDLYASVRDASNVPDNSTGTIDTTRGKIFRSPAGPTAGNAGTWINITPAPAANSYWRRIELAVSGVNPNTVFAIMQGTGNAVGGIRVSTNAGANWTNRDNATVWCDQGIPGTTDFTRDQAWYDLLIAPKPDDDNTIYVGGVDIMKSTNGGTTWNQNTQWADGCAVLPNIHADNHNLVHFPGSPNEFIIVNDGGIYYSNNNGVSYTNKSVGYRTIQYYSAAIHPTAGSNYMLAGAQDNGTQSFSAAGLGAGFSVTGGDGGFCGIDQDNPNYQYSAYTTAYYEISTNAGTDFNKAAYFGGGTNGRFINPTDYASTQNIIYAGYTPTNLLRINDITAASVTANAINFASATSRQVSAVKVDPNTPNRVWAAFSQYTPTFPVAPQLYYVSNANGGSPVITTITLPAAITTAHYISSIDVENGDANHIVITVSNYGVASIYESTDLGANWVSLDNNGVNLPDMPVRWAKFIPAGVSGFSGRMQAVSGIMIATEIGVWTATTRSGSTTVWTQSTAMPNVRVDMLAYRTTDRTMVAATHGRGLWTTTLQSTLPVTLLTFEGKLDNNTALLNWTTNTEYNSRDFDIEKSTDGINYKKIGTIPAAVNSNTEKKYSFRDLKLSPSNYYRLKMNDIDGESKLSNVVLIKYNDIIQNLAIVTTPFNNHLDIKITKPASQVKLQLLNSGGSLVAEKTFTNAWGLMRWDVPAQLSKGIYVVRAVIDGEVFINKTVKQ